MTRPGRRRRAIRGTGEQLHDEIVVAARKLLAEAERADDVSIRAVADAVGVTAPSIYLHFADKQALLEAVVADVFRELDEEMLAAGADLAEPMARLRAYGLAYVRFAVAHPQHYALAMMQACPGPVPQLDEVLQSSAFNHFHSTVADCIAADIFPGGDALSITFDLWTAAHGIAAMVIAKPYLPFGELDEFADRVLCAAALGQAARQLLGGSPTPDEATEWVARERRAAVRRRRAAPRPS